MKTEDLREVTEPGVDNKDLGGEEVKLSARGGEVGGVGRVALGA